MNKTVNHLLFGSLLLAALASCKNYKEITKKPDRLSQEVVLPSPESTINLALKIDLLTLQKQLNETLRQGFSDEQEGTFEYRSWIKTKDPLYDPNPDILTKDPLYHPNKWIKTKDPLYNPKKWIKGPFGFKTKNPFYHPNKWLETDDPLYHPNEWIKTNNPLYHPNEWIETKGPAVALGYKYDFAVTLIRDIQLQYVDATTLKIIAPIAITGSAGFKGPLPEGLSLDRKNFDGKIEFYINTRVSVNHDWCPVLDVSVKHTWLSNPQIEIMNNIYVSVTGISDKFINKFEKNINALISKQINCEQLRDIVKEKWHPYSVELPALLDGKKYYLNIIPSGAALSSLVVSNDSLALYAGVRSRVSLDDKAIKTPTSFPVLEEQTASRGNVNVFLPLNLKYADIQNNANIYLRANHIELNPDIILKQKASIQIKEMDIYPNGDQVVIGVNIKAKLPKRILPVSGWIYLLGKPVMVGNKKFQLDSVDFSMDVNNKFYPAISSIFKKTIVKEIEKQTTFDLTKKVEEVKKIIAEKAKVPLNKQVSLSVKNLDLGIDDIVLTDEEISIITELSANFDVVFKGK